MVKFRVLVMFTWRISSRRSSGTLGNSRFCSTVSRTVPSPYLQGARFIR